MPTVHITIKGKVQGVFYRATAKDVAEEIGIKGWVKNTSDGNVEAIASGTEEQVQRFLEWCRKGPSKAVVTDVVIEQLPEQNVSKFEIKR